MGTTLRLAAAATLATTLAILAAQVGAQNVPSDLLLTDPTNATGNASSACLSRAAASPCPDPDLHFFLYSGHSGESEEMDASDPTWLAKSRYNSSLPTVMLVHGYRGGDSLMPMVILKNAYIKLGSFNVIMVDWGAFVRPPCYVQAVGNVKLVAKCIGQLMASLEEGGVATENVTCIGHSLGAQVCGVLANYAPQKLNKIIALDPARPFYQLAAPNDRLDAKDAKVVQVIHTNAGFYGLPNVVGTADFCVNNGAQPFCRGTRNEQLCSHAHAVCFQAESLDPSRAQRGVACTNSCPNGRLKKTRAEPVMLGHHMDDSASGMYCVTAPDPPFCRNATLDPDYGDPRCCPVYPS